MTHWIGVLLTFCVLNITQLQAGTSSLRAWGGGVWLHHHSKEDHVKHSPGYAYGASYGTSWFCYLRTEIEVFRLHTALNQRTQQAKASGNEDNYGALFNLAVECPFSISKLKLCPYAGAGLGASYAKTKVNIKKFVLHKLRERHFSHQYFGGISFPILPFFIGEISASVEGRYYVFDKHTSAILAIGGIALKF